MLLRKPSCVAGILAVVGAILTAGLGGPPRNRRRVSRSRREIKWA